MPGFYNKALYDRVQAVAEQASLSKDEVDTLSGTGLSLDGADHMIENVIGLYSLPLGIATNFRINQNEVLVPMVLEEPSVVAGASLAARLARETGGFIASSDEPVMIAQMQILDLANLHQARLALLAQKQRILEFARTTDPVIMKLVYSSILETQQSWNGNDSSDAAVNLKSIFLRVYSCVFVGAATAAGGTEPAAGRDA